MKAIAEKNKFKGINPLLNSLNQTRKASRQSSFQAIHSAVLRDVLLEKLPPQYTAEIEQGMELLRFIQLGSEQLQDGYQSWKPDVDVREWEQDRGAKSRQVASTFTPAIEAKQSEIDRNIEDRYVAIYRLDPEDVAEKGHPVAVIEMLSPSNLSKEGLGQTKGKLLSYTQVGLTSVWLDYMHAFPSPFPGVPLYPHGHYADGDPATPYYIAISNPKDLNKRDQGENPLADIYPFGVDHEIPTLEIPLLGSDAVVIDFNNIYQQAYEKGFYKYVDYRQPPRRQQTYRDDDQRLIEQRRRDVLRELGFSIDEL